MLCTAAQAHGLDPVWLLALVMAESGKGPDPRAERWGVWPDVSFGYAQFIVLYSYVGDHTNTPENIQFVRDYVFAHPAEDLDQAAAKLAWALDYASDDGSILGALTAYNAGSDRRDDPGWMARWGGNVISYGWALEWAEGYRA